MAILKALVGTRLPEKYHKFLDLPERRSSYRYTDTRNTALGAMSALLSESETMRSGIYRLKSGREALGARLALIDTAEVSIDIQSYLIRYDIAGNLLSQRLVAAARRGVRVRLLMDDALTPGADDGLTVLDGHQGIEVRVFNPFPRHRSRLLSLLLNFNLLNRRMHNKSFTVDNAVTIVGGRNIADEYYQTSETEEFLDEDLLAAGEVVDAVGQSFDDYWNAREACPVHFLRPALPEAEAKTVIQSGLSLISEPRTQQYIESLEFNFATRLLGGAVPLSIANAEAVYDEPAKIRSLVRKQASGTSLYLQQLAVQAVHFLQAGRRGHGVSRQAGIDGDARTHHRVAVFRAAPPGSRLSQRSCPEGRTRRGHNEFTGVDQSFQCPCCIRALSQAAAQTRRRAV